MSFDKTRLQKYAWYRVLVIVFILLAIFLALVSGLIAFTVGQSVFYNLEYESQVATAPAEFYLFSMGAGFATFAISVAISILLLVALRAMTLYIIRGNLNAENK